MSSYANALVENLVKVFFLNKDTIGVEKFIVTWV